MLGFLSKTKDSKDLVKKDSIYFISIPDGDRLSADELYVRVAPAAQAFANKLDLNTVYFLFGEGKDEFIKYEYSI